MFFRFLLILLVCSEVGCGLSSGMVSPTNADAKKNSSGNFNREIIQISPSFILSQIKQKASNSAAPEIAPKHLPKVEYRIAAHDTLAITVWEHPELTTPAGSNPPTELLGNIVRSDGNIFYPYVGLVQVAGKTVEEVRNLITKKLTHYIEKPQVGIRVINHNSQHVYVTGEINIAKTITLTGAPTDVIKAINQAGGPKVSADLSRVHLIHRDGSKEILNLAKLQTEGKLSENKLLQAGDHIFIPDNSNNVIFVTGEVNAPGSKLIGYQRYTLTRALADAGGINNDTSNPSRVYVLRGFTETANNDNPKAYVEIYQLDAGSPAGLVLGNQFVLQAQDVIFVSSTEISRWGRVMSNLASTIQAINLARLFQ